ncbi:MAG: glucose-1-phosphate thymidylyltransferase [Desulfarculus sp.]|jgi:glucose-1-phosphate thymidylyltransferase|nr:MAG: glucose-1-phosphate thymidylyltransferase [Desulfarculus sp.]
MKGIILAGGMGTRLYPMTKVVSKQLLPIYDKPMIYYPLSVLMMGGIKDILVISTPNDLPLYRSLLADGQAWGISISYAEQPRPEGLAQAFIIGRDFVGDDDVCLILGDNLFYGVSFPKYLQEAISDNKGGTVFVYPVKDPWRYGVITMDKDGRPVDIQEKPEAPKSNYAVTGLYIYKNEVLDIASRIKPSARGELEISDVNKAFLSSDRLSVIRLGRGIAWMDTGTPEALLEASSFIRTLENRQGLKIACIEEVGYRMGYIGAAQMRALIDSLGDGEYSQYLGKVLKEDIY